MCRNKKRVGEATTDEEMKAEDEFIIKLLKK